MSNKTAKSQVWRRKFIHCVGDVPTWKAIITKVSAGTGFVGLTGTCEALHQDFDRGDFAAMKQATAARLAEMFPGCTIRLMVKSRRNDPRNETLSDWARAN